MSFPYPSNGYNSYYPASTQYASSNYSYVQPSSSYGVAQYNYPQTNYVSNSDSYAYSQPYYGGTAYGQDPYASSYGSYGSSYGNYGSSGSYGNYGSTGDYGYGDPYSTQNYLYTDKQTTYTYGPPVIVDNTKYYFEPAPPSNYWTSLNDQTYGSYNTSKNFNFQINYIKDNVYDFTTPDPDPDPDPGNNPTKVQNNNPGKQVKPTKVVKNNTPSTPPPIEPGFQEGRFYNKQRVPGRFN